MVLKYFMYTLIHVEDSASLYYFKINIPSVDMFFIFTSILEQHVMFIVILKHSFFYVYGCLLDLGPHQ